MQLLNNKILRIALLLVAIVAQLSACSDSNNNGNNNDREPDNKTDSLIVTSYNVGLALNFVPFTQERLVANEALLADYNSDVLCLQEVWLDESVEAIEQALSEDYPYIYTVEAEQIFSDEAPCTDEEIAGFADCANEQCPGLSGSDLVACAPVQCGSFLPELSAGCADAVFGAVGIPDVTVDAIVEAVTQPTGKFAFGGALGLMMASKYELQLREFQDFIDDSSVNHRGALYAEIDVNEQSHVVSCRNR